MEVRLNLDLSTHQKLIINQNMKQSIKILQMSSYDLREYIDEELENNPVLEGDFDFVSSKDIYECKISYKEAIEERVKENYILSSEFQYNNENEISPFNFIEQKKSLRDYLYEQLGELKFSEEKKYIIAYMIESLDNKGYLENSLENICEELGVSKIKCEDALRSLQKLEPYGIGARSLTECLIIQLNIKGIFDEILENIIENYLEYIADSKYHYIAKELNITAKEVQEYEDIIKKLEPKPSRGYYTGDETKYIIPDAYIIKYENEYNIIINRGIIPSLRINDLYIGITRNNSNIEEVKYIKEKIASAINLIKGIENRNNTLFKLLECIVEKQKEYFEKGNKYLKPMTLKEIANEINFHESTVSRSIKDKYILTDGGTIKIKDLFCCKISVNHDENKDISVNNVKSKIEYFISRENNKKPFSDQAICELLAKEKIYISRRTVAKYREELGIRSSSKRKRI